MKNHLYRIRCAYIEDSAGNTPEYAPLEFDAHLHEDIFAIMKTLKAGEKMPAQSVEPFVLGLKLFGETLLRHKDSALCAELLPHFTELMKTIKRGGKS